MGSSQYINVSTNSLREAFHRAGFARKGNTKNALAPCPPGTFVNVSVSFSGKLECLECPAGKSRDCFVFYNTQIVHF